MAFSMHAATFSNAASLQKILGCGERYISTAASSPVLCSSAPTTFDRGPGVCVDINAAISWISGQRERWSRIRAEAERGLTSAHNRDVRNLHGIGRPDQGCSDICRWDDFMKGVEAGLDRYHVLLPVISRPVGYQYFSGVADSSNNPVFVLATQDEGDSWELIIGVINHDSWSPRCVNIRDHANTVPHEVAVGGSSLISGRSVTNRRAFTGLPPGPEHWRERSRFLKGIAEAMADQWGDYATQQFYQEAA